MNFEIEKIDCTEYGGNCCGCNNLKSQIELIKVVSEKLKSDNSEYVSQAKSCRNCKRYIEGNTKNGCLGCMNYSWWEPA